MADRDFVKPKAWEGKPLSYKLKFAWARYPEMAMSFVVFGFIAPAIIAYRLLNHENSRDAYLSKYKRTYMVLRDDDPNVERFVKEKEAGRHLFPKY